MQEIRIIMDGGIIQDIVVLTLDAPLRVQIRDYDIEGCSDDELVKDDTGDEYYPIEWDLTG